MIYQESVLSQNFSFSMKLKSLRFLSKDRNSLWFLFYCGGAPSHGAQCELGYLFRRAHRECSAEICFMVYVCYYPKSDH